MPHTPLHRSALRANLSRRDWFGVAGKGTVGVVLSQSLLACAGGDLTATAAGTTGAVAAGTCALTAALTEGPYFVDEKLLRTDIRPDSVTGVVSAGVPLSLTFNVSRLASNACTPLTGAYLDVWHCDAGGLYSDESANGTSGKKYLRGYQITDANGVAQFQTVYPG